MKIYVITSNKYTRSLCPPNIHFLNKYWPNQQISIVGYEDVNKLTDLPSNVETVCLGKQNEFGKMWTNALIPYFETVAEDYFVIMLDDHFLLGPVDFSKMNIVENWVKEGKADKAMIGGGISLYLSRKISENMLLFDQHIDYRTSLHPAIWKKSYFLKYLKPNMTSWDFEIKNNAEARGDGAKIINFHYKYPAQPHLFSCFELCNKGEFTINEKGEFLTDQPGENFFAKEDIMYIWNQINKPIQ